MIDSVFPLCIRQAAGQPAIAIPGLGQAADAHPGASPIAPPGSQSSFPVASTGEETTQPADRARVGEVVVPSTPPVPEAKPHRGQSETWPAEANPSEPRSSAALAASSEGSVSSDRPVSSRSRRAVAADFLRDDPAIVIGLHGVGLIRRPRGCRPVLHGWIPRPPARKPSRKKINRFDKTLEWSMLSLIASRNRLLNWSMLTMEVVGESLGHARPYRYVGLNYADFRLVGMRPRRIVVPNHRHRIAVTSDGYMTPPFTALEAAAVRQRFSRFVRFLRRGLGMPVRPFVDRGLPGSWWESQVEFFICADDEPEPGADPGLVEHHDGAPDQGVAEAT